MNRCAWALIFALPALMLMHGCTDSKAIPETEKVISNFTEYTKPEPPKLNATAVLPEETKVGKNETLQEEEARDAEDEALQEDDAEDAASETDEEAEAPRMFTHNSSGFSFVLPDGTSLIEGEGCKYWGGGEGCVAVVQADRAAIAEYRLGAMGHPGGLRRHLESQELIVRADGSEWFSAILGKYVVIGRERMDAQTSSMRLYWADGKRLHYLRVEGAASVNATMMQIFQSAEVDGEGMRGRYPLEFECSVNHDCLLGEFCYSGGSMCIAINASDPDIYEGFGNSTYGCISGTGAVCKRECQTNDECPQGQVCRHVIQYTTSGYEIGAPKRINFDRKFCS